MIQNLDEAPLNLFHLRAVVISGVGFFTDAYDLFVIGAALALLKDQWHLSQSMIGLVGSTTLVANFIGAFLFGRLADLFGRKRFYVLVPVLMALAAIGTAFAPNIGWLIAFRILLGVGIGGDYPLSAVMTSEYANVRDRGKLVGLVFSMQALGLIAGPIVAITLLASGMPHNLVWRLMLGLGALPSLAVVYLRSKMPESPRYEAHRAARRAVRPVGPETEPGPASNVSASAVDQRSGAVRFGQFIRNRKMRLTLLGTAGTWFLFDYAYYGNSISTPQIMQMIAPHATLLQSEAWTLIVFAVAAVPGYYLAVGLVDKIGHKRLQLIGFAVMGLAFLAMGVFPGATATVGPFLMLYGVSYFFAEFGPNTTTFILAAELYPVSVRTTGHGLSAGTAKVGAFIGVFIFPLLSYALGLRGTLIVTALFSLAGFLLTFLLPEAANKSMEEMTLTFEEPSRKAVKRILRRA
ncbi:MFS transporter [Alicyclobacillus cycloheptanicus]|uniref:MFS family permease n=1 Tax=Alicyclobacillus cycloheptanicus TaxID=1457 RepID=A0ABT9XHE7_9BACL|nr:MFS transporter [Alicyclobacillus cycloheptanicus]MDQ0189731.1 MFS family permease [Alicyclobacillus cycloheptanicus]WDM01942.1 MFS transporter [Alicyclobacillus cycloheptanicus]